MEEPRDVLVFLAGGWVEVTLQTKQSSWERNEIWRGEEISGPSVELVCVCALSLLLFTQASPDTEI